MGSTLLTQLDIDLKKTEVEASRTHQSYPVPFYAECGVQGWYFLDTLPRFFSVPSFSVTQYDGTWPSLEQGAVKDYVSNDSWETLLHHAETEHFAECANTLEPEGRHFEQNEPNQ